MAASPNMNNSGTNSATAQRPSTLLVFLPDQQYQSRRAPPARNSSAGRGILVEEMPTIAEEGSVPLQQKRRSSSTSTISSISSTSSGQGHFLELVPEQSRDEEMYEYL